MTRRTAAWLAAAVLLVAVTLGAILVGNASGGRSEAETRDYLAAMLADHGRPVCAVLARNAGTRTLDGVTDYLVRVDDLDRAAARDFLDVECPTLI